MTAQKLLIIEDDLRLATFTRMSLETQGYHTCLTVTGSEGCRQLAQQQIDLVLLDLELPDGSGIDFCRQIRARWTLPVIIFSAERNIETKIKALEAGANDYIVKPIDVRELLARVRVQLRDAQPPSGPQTRTGVQASIGKLRFDTPQNFFYADELPLPLSEIEHNLLRVFFHSSPALLSKAELYHQIWGGSYQPERDAHLVETHVSRLRSRLKNSDADCRIQTLYGKGYYLTPCSQL